jgi:hypothetical protein
VDRPTIRSTSAGRWNVAPLADVVASVNSPTTPHPATPGTRVAFDVAVVLPITPETAWQRLTDWPSHGDWIPMTRVEVDPADPNRFTAWSGPGPLALEDRMQADPAEFDGSSGRCRVAKLGPVLVGEAEFSVGPALAPGSCTVVWREDVTVPRLPSVFAPAVGWVAARLFALSLRRMSRVA